MNRKEFYGNTNRNDTQYRVTVIKIDKNSDKNKQKNHLMKFKENYFNVKSEVNLATKIKNNKDFFSTNIIGIGLRSSLENGMTADNIKEVNFLFFDFEEPKSGTEKLILSFDECLKILNDNNINYILKTSYNHTEEKPRLHLFLPLLKPIKSTKNYKYNFDVIHKKYFSKYACDTNVNNPARWIYTSHSDSLRYAYSFDKRDTVAMDANNFPEDTSNSKKSHKFNKKEMTKEEHEKHSFALEVFNKQVQSLYGFIYSEDDSNKKLLKYHRNKDDNIANLWYSIDNDSYTIWDKKIPHSVLFSYQDIIDSINSEDKREELLRRLQGELAEWFTSGGKYYTITNEGLGKSSTIIKLGKKYKFIFVCHTNQRVNEVAQKLKDERIAHKVIYSNSKILEMNGYENLKTIYENEMKKDKHLSFLKFINHNIKDDNKRENVKKEYNKNLEDLKEDNCVRIITAQKLRLIFATNNATFKKEMKHRYIVFDEFDFNQWSCYEAPEDGDEIVQKPTIWFSKNNVNKLVNLKERSDSFLKLLEGVENVLILTTERMIVKAFFSQRGYREIIANKKSLSSYEPNLLESIKFDKKLYDNSVIYFLTTSTKKGDFRDNLITQIKYWFKKTYNEDIYTISDGTPLRDISHLAIKGSNEYQEKNLLILGTLGAELTDNIFYYSCEKYFNKPNDAKNEKKTEAVNSRMEPNNKKKIMNFISKLHMSGQVSQSIGRNSGFRQQGYKTIVVLPLLSENRKRVFKPFSLNYISENVIIFNQDFIDKNL